MERKESVSAAAYTYTVLLQPEPEHRGDLPPGTLRAIIRQAGLGIDELLDRL